MEFHLLLFRFCFGSSVSFVSASGVPSPSFPLREFRLLRFRFGSFISFFSGFCFRFFPLFYIHFVRNFPSSSLHFFLPFAGFFISILFFLQFFFSINFPPFSFIHSLILFHFFLPFSFHPFRRLQPFSFILIFLYFLFCQHGCVRFGSERDSKPHG